MRFEYADARMPVAMTAGGVTYYLTYDQVGSLRLVADATGTIVKRIDYDSFGNIISDSNPAFTLPFGFAGGLHDRDAGLVRFGFRDYDPEVGIWTAKDPIGFGGGDVDLYGYVANNPVNWIDPWGLIWVTTPNDPCRDKDFPIGTHRIIPQTYREFINPGPSKVLINHPEAPFYYQWDPWVDSPTYRDYPGTKYPDLYYWRQWR